MHLTNNTRRTLWICGLLVAVTLAAFLPVANHAFTNLDDHKYVWLNLHVNNGLHWEGVTWAFRTGYMGNWHPLTWVSHMLDVQFFGLRPGWHHLTNVLFHAANSVLLFLVLQRLTRRAWRSACVAALFALHPLHVESVAWISERKDVLSAFFFMLTLWAYIRFAQCEPRNEECGVQSREAGASNQRSVASSGQTADYELRTTLWYLLALMFFTLGLMSKGMLVTVPFVLLLLDYWPLDRIRLRSKVQSLMPGRVSVPASPDATCDGIANSGHRTSNIGQPASGSPPSASGIQHPVSRIALPSSPLWPLLLEKVPFFALTVAGSLATFVAQQHYGAVRSLEALSVSERLGNALVAYAGYLRQAFWPTGLAVFYPLQHGPTAASAIVAGAVLLAVTAWALASVRSSPHIFVGWFWFLGMLVPVIGLVQIGQQQRADRYTYLPLIGLFVMVVWEICRRWSALRQKPAVRATAAAMVLVACFALTRLQVSYWRDNERLFRHAVEVTRDNWFAHHGLGHALVFQGKPDEAILHYQAAAAIRPSPELRQVLGVTLSQRDRLEEAAAQFTELIKQKPDDVPALVQLGIVRARQQKEDEAELAFVTALRIDPADAEAHNSYGNLLAQQSKHEHAVRQFEEALRLAPHYAAAHSNLAISCAKLRRMSEAIAHSREAIRLQPGLLQAVNSLAWLFATDPDARFRNGAEAVELATRACEMTRYQDLIPLATLAAAYAETGRFQEAVSFAERAQELAKGASGARPDRLSAMLKEFGAGQAYHEE